MVTYIALFIVSQLALLVCMVVYSKLTLTLDLSLHYL